MVVKGPAGGESECRIFESGMSLFRMCFSSFCGRADLLGYCGPLAPAGTWSYLALLRWSRSKALFSLTGFSRASNLFSLKDNDAFLQGPAFNVCGCGWLSTGAASISSARRCREVSGRAYIWLAKWAALPRSGSGQMVVHFFLCHHDCEHNTGIFHKGRG